MNQFSAANSLTGYLYQVRTALQSSLSRLRTTPNFLVSLETIDDVVFEDKDCAPEELLQTKFHQSREATLSDYSPDLWKSLRIWFEAFIAKGITTQTTLYLITTAKAQTGSIVSKLRVEDRDVQAAMNSLFAIAQTSTNAANKSSYELYKSIPVNDRLLILNNVYILDSGASMSELDERLRALLFSAARREHLESFLTRLEGWWIRRVIRQIADPSNRILSVELEAQLGDLREQFTQESLPIDHDLLQYKLDQETESAHVNSVFVRQIELTRASKRRIAAAIRDYYRAFEQRSRWLREDLANIDEIATYEKKLIEEWELAFEAAVDDLRITPSSEEKAELGRKVLRWAEECVIGIRPRVIEPFVSRGSLHMLADELRVGWHPDFREKLKEILTAEQSTV